METMILEELTTKVIDKVRRLYKDVPSYNEILSHHPSVTVNYDDDKKTLTLSSISFNDWNKIYIHSKGISFIPYTYNSYNNNETVLIIYDSFEELLNL